MRNLLIVFFVLGLIVLIVLFPFKTRFMGHINLLEKKCYYSVKSWMIKLFCGKICIEDGKLQMNNLDTFLTGDIDKDFIKQISAEILGKLDVKKVEIFFTGGFKENSFSSAIICGIVLSAVETLYGYLSLSFDDVKMYKDVNPTFDEDNLELTLDIVVSISLMQLIKCFFKASNNVKEIKEVKNEG